MAFLQVNVNHSPAAQDLALVAAGKVDASVIVITEPYLFNGRLPSTPSWQRVFTQRAAILMKKDIRFAEITVDSDSVVAVEIGGVLIVACYLSPNEEPNRSLNVVHGLLCRGRKVVLTGDFNCRISRFFTGRLRERSII